MKYSSENPVELISKTLDDEKYKQERLSPKPEDYLYLHLSDLRLFLNRYTNNSFNQLLDYGCGGSPYKDLFKTKQYIRADYVDCGGNPILIGTNESVDLPDNSCDVVLSTQVLEHVFSPQAYLAEAFRVLRPGGKLILTTHGTWPDHGCPYDFWRWTADGLIRELKKAGFDISGAFKMTTGPRGALFILGEFIHRLCDSRRHLSGWFLWLLRHSPLGILEWRNKLADKLFSEHRLVAHDVPKHEFYLGLGIEGIKP